MNSFTKFSDDIKDTYDNDNLILNKCTHNCGRYVHDKKSVCCSKCNGFSNKHSSKCEADNVSIKLASIHIRLRCVNNNIEDNFLNICTFKNIDKRLFEKIEEEVLSIFKENVCISNVGCENDLQLKTDKFLHKGQAIYIRGSFVEYRKKLFTFLEKIIKSNSLDNNTYKFADILTDKNHVVLNLSKTSLKAQLFILWNFENNEISYKTIFTIY